MPELLDTSRLNLEINTILSEHPCWVGSNQVAIAWTISGFGHFFGPSENKNRRKAKFIHNLFSGSSL